MNQNVSPEEIACFRYQCFAPMLTVSEKAQKKWLQELTTQWHQIPGQKEKRRISAHTIRNWKRAYQKNGFAGLVPKNRSDKHQSRVLSESMQVHIRDILSEYPTLSAMGIYRKLAQLQAGELPFAESAVRRYIKTNKLRNPELKLKSRKKFECPTANQLWMVDFMHGVHIPDTQDHNRRKKTYLCAIMDDHSRLIVGAQFYFHENSEALMKTFKSSIQRYGIPARFYCDNGASFSSQYLVRVCARLGTALIHSRPYDSPSRGKIERFFRTVRESFFASTNLKAIRSLSEMNLLFHKWLTESYQEKVHSSTCQKPKDRYFLSLESVSLKRKPADQIEEDFLGSCFRKVKRDRTIRFLSQEFELPAQYIGQRVEVRYPLEDPLDLRLYDSEVQFVCKLSLVDPIGNSETPALGIRFNRETEQPS